MPRPDLETSALQEWINSFRIGRTVKSSAELSDGFVLWEILQDIDAQHFLGDLPESSSSSDHWVPRWQNLKHIHKLLLSYVRDQNDGEMPAGLSTVPDLKAIAENSSTRETNQLLKLLLMAAISSPNAESYIITMQSLSTPTQEGLKDIIQEAHDPSEDRLEQLRDEQDDFRARREVAVDPELQFEERVGKLLAENDKLSHEKKELEKAMDDLHDRLARLQEHNDTLQDRLHRRSPGHVKVR
jgi:protein HOOK3